MARCAVQSKAIQAPCRLSRSISASPFVGRDDELRRLDSALALAAQGQGRTVFLTGQPGIGKTRLAREALASARARGFTTLAGRAYSLETGLSYAPFIEAFGPFLHAPSAEGGNPSTEGHGLDPAELKALLSGLPSLGRLFEGIGLPPPEPVGDPGLEKTRLFESVSRLLARLAHKAPVAFLVDDLHQADPATLDLLHYMVRGMVDQRVLLLASYGTDALEHARSLRAVTASLQRDGLAEEIIIPRLKRDEVNEMVRAILGGQAPSDLLAFLDARAGGTPLFIEALLTALVDDAGLVCTDRGWVLDAGGTAFLPPSVRRLVMERLERLAPTDRRVVELISVMGDATKHTVLRAASGLEEEDLIESVRRLIAIGLVVEGIEGLDSTYDIAHPLIQEVAYAELPGAARRRAHLAAIKAIESSQGKDDVSRLARHYRGAGIEADPARALEVLLAAGERARAIYANEEAAQHYAAALAIVRGDQGPGGGGHGMRILTSCSLPWLLERLGDVWERIGKHGAALELWNEALGLLSNGERAGDRVAAPRLHNRLAAAEANQGHFDMAKAHVAAGMEALASQGPIPELADLYYTRCSILGRLGDVAGLAESTAKHLSIAERLASPRAQAAANLIASVTSLEQNDVDDARERAQRALVAAEHASDPAICYRVHALLLVIAMRMGEHRLMRYHAECGLALAQHLGAPSYEVHPRLRLAYADFLAGAWDESMLNSMEAVRLARRVGNPRELAYSLAERAMLLALRGELSEAAACVSEVRSTFDTGTLVDRAVFGLVDVAETAIAFEQGETKRALAIARGFVRQSALVAAPADLTLLSMPIGLMLLAEVQVAAGEPEGSLETARKIACLGSPGTPYLTALACRAEALVRQAVGQQEAAMACLARAYEAFTSLDMPFEAARTLLQRAILTRAERTELSTGAARESLAIFERLGARRHADRARQLLGGLHISPSAPRQRQLREGPLSRRELEVARLVAEGLASGEIAKRMAVSRCTVNAHLDHIYRRLKIGSRAALTRYVIEAGLLPLAQGED